MLWFCGLITLDLLQLWMSSFEVAVMSCTECPSPLTYLHHRAFYCGGPSSREGREWTCCLNDVWCTPCEMPGRGGDSLKRLKWCVESWSFFSEEVCWHNNLVVELMHPYKRASILTDLSNTCYFQTLVLNSRTAAQSIKLIVPRYRL